MIQELAKGQGLKGGKWNGFAPPEKMFCERLWLIQLLPVYIVCVTLYASTRISPIQRYSWNLQFLKLTGSRFPAIGIWRLLHSFTMLTLWQLWHDLTTLEPHVTCNSIGGMPGYRNNGRGNVRGGNIRGMLRPRGLCGLEAKLFGLGLVASGLGLIEVGLVASKFAAYMD